MHWWGQLPLPRTRFQKSWTRSEGVFLTLSMACFSTLRKLVVGRRQCDIDHTGAGLGTWDGGVRDGAGLLRVLEQRVDLVAQHGRGRWGRLPVLWSVGWQHVDTLWC